MTFEEFIQEYQNLKLQYPAVPTHSLRCENCDFGDYLYSCKNCYIAFDCVNCEDSVYLFDSFKAKNCLDGDYVIESELVYDSVDTFRCYKSAYLNYCARVYNCYFAYDCNDSHDLFGCTHLKHKQYCIFNRQYEKEEYFKMTKELLKRSAEENFKELKKLIERYPMTETNVTHAENCDYGNHVHYSKNLYLCFDATHSEDSGYLYDSHYIKNSYDLNQCAYSELCYRCSDSARIYHCHHMDYCSEMYDSAFCFNCKQSHHLFGCVRVFNKKYHFLNKPYPKEEWKKSVAEVMESFKQSVQ